MLAIYIPFNVFSIFEKLDIKNFFKEKEKKALGEYLGYLKSQVEFVQRLIDKNQCEFIKEIDIENTLIKIDKTKKMLKNYLKKEKDKEIYSLIDEIYTYLLKYEFSISQLWACSGNS